VAFDAGTIVAHMDLDDAEFKRKLDEDVARVEAFERREHEIKLTAKMNESDISQARRAMQRLDTAATNDARSRGGIFGVLHGLFGRGGRMPGGDSGGNAHILARLFSSASGGGGGFGANLLSGAGPGMGLLSPQAAMIGAAIPIVGGALPALAGVGGVAGIGAVGAGVAALGAKTLIGTKKDPGPAYAQAQTAMDAMKDVITKGAQPMLAPLRQALRQIPQMLHGLLPEIKGLFGAAGTLIQPVLHGLVDIARDILPGLSRAFRAVAPSIRPLLDGVGLLVKNIFPGLNALLRAMAPVMGIFARALANVGRDLGAMFKAFAPAVRPSMIILKALLDAVGSLLPVIGKLAAIFAVALAPVIVAFGKAIKILEPSLLIIGRLLARLAGAVLQDLAAILISVAKLIAGIAPSLTILAGALGKIFATMESSGVFGALATAMEQLAPLFAQLINLIVRQLVPIMPVLIGLFVQITTIMVSGFAEGLKLILQGVTWLLQHFPMLVPIIAGITLAWLAWNLVMSANPIGLIIIAISLLIGSIVFLATHWHRVWTDIKNWAMDAWNFLTHGWGQWLIPGLTLIRKVVEFVRDHWRQAWNDIKQAGLDAWHFIHDNIISPLADFFTKKIPGYFDTCVSAVGKAWGVIKDTVRKPVAWVVDNVVNGLINAFNWVSDRVHGPHIKSPVHPFGLQKGGKLPGWGGGDILPALLEPGETVVSKEHSARLGDVFAAIGVPGYQHGGRVLPGTGGRGQQAIHQGQNLAAGGQHNIFSTIWHKGGDIAKAVLAIATGNQTALRNALMDLFPHGVGGAGVDLATLLTTMPAQLLTAAIKTLLSFGGGGLGGKGAEIAKWAMQWAGKIPYVWGGTAVPGGADCSGFTQAVYRHFGILAPRTSEAQGAWVTRGSPQIGGLAFYNSPAGGPPPGHVAIVGFGGNVISQGGGMGPQIQPLRSMPLMFTGIPPGGKGTGGRGSWNLGSLEGLWGRAGGPASQAHVAAAIALAESSGNPLAHNPSGASGLWQILGQVFPGNIFDPYINARNAVRKYYQAGGFSPWVTYETGAYRQFMDNGGWMLGGNYVNATGQPEAVLNPRQSQAFVDLADAAHALQKGGGGLMRDVYLMLPEGTTVAKALAEVGWHLRVMSNAGYSGVTGG